jgi:hypothetical protein
MKFINKILFITLIGVWLAVFLRGIKNIGYNLMLVTMVGQGSFSLY